MLNDSKTEEFTIPYFLWNVLRKTICYFLNPLMPGGNRKVTHT